MDGWPDWVGDDPEKRSLWARAAGMGAAGFILATERCTHDYLEGAAARTAAPAPDCVTRAQATAMVDDAVAAAVEDVFASAKQRGSNRARVMNVMFGTAVSVKSSVKLSEEQRLAFSTAIAARDRDHKGVTRCLACRKKAECAGHIIPLRAFHPTRAPFMSSWLGDDYKLLRASPRNGMSLCRSCEEAFERGMWTLETTDRDYVFRAKVLAQDLRWRKPKEFGEVFDQSRVHADLRISNKAVYLRAIGAVTLNECSVHESVDWEPEHRKSGDLVAMALGAAADILGVVDDAPPAEAGDAAGAADDGAR